MIQITQQFEFCASHRLHCRHLSEQANLELFGKCNGPNGHGHNYLIDVTLAGFPCESGQLIRLSEFEKIVHEVVLRRFDHKYLNLDVCEFLQTNPTVENITLIIWRLLDGRFQQAQLARVKVYETPKTSAEYGRTDQELLDLLASK